MSAQNVPESGIIQVHTSAEMFEATVEQKLDAVGDMGLSATLPWAYVTAGSSPVIIVPPCKLLVQ